MNNWLQRAWHEGGPPQFLELAGLFGLTAGAVLVLGTGENNGIGYFQSRQGDILLPLALGSLVNLGIFLLAAMAVLPRLRRQHSALPVLGWLVCLVAANVALQTVIQMAIIAWRDTHLRALSVSDLALENLYAAVLTLALAFLYRAGRDWLSVRLPQAVVVPCLTFGEGAGQHRFPIAEIRHIKSAGNYLEVTTRRRMTLVYGALKDAEARLAGHGFARIHRSWVVNLAEVRRLTPSRAVLDDAELPVGARFAKAAQAAWVEGAQTPRR